MNWFISTKVKIVVRVFEWFYFFVEKQKQIIYKYQVTDNNRGIESPDLEKVDDRCPEKVIILSILNEGEYCFLLGESIKTAMASVLGKGRVQIIKMEI